MSGRKRYSLGILSAILIIAVLTLLANMALEKITPNQDVKFETYVWRDLSPSTIGPFSENDSAYQPIIFKISQNVEEQTGISLETVVAQGGEVIFNFFYTDISPLVAGKCDLVEIIIMTTEGKIIENFILRYTEEHFKTVKENESI